MIPKVLHFIWIGDDAKRPDNFLNSWTRNNPGWTVKLWSNDDLVSRAWKNRRRMGELGRIDARLVAELMRWEILFEEGGLVFDIDSACVRPLDDFLLECEMFACWDHELSQPGLVSSKFVGAGAGNPLVGAVIQSIQADPPLPAPGGRQDGDCRRLTRLWRESRYAGLTVFPSHYFNPRAADGLQYQGRGRVYAVHQWASTLARVPTLYQSEVEREWAPALAGPAPQRAAPRFSIVIPTYNHADMLGAAIESALAQTYPDFEIVVVDDGSTDSTPDVLAAQRDRRVRSVRQPNAGEAAARNRGLYEARGDYVVWLDSDDLLLPGTLALYARQIEGGPPSDVLYGHLIMIDKEGKRTSQVRYEDLAAVPPLPNLFLRNRLPNPGTAVRRGLFNSIGLYDTTLESSPDYDVWIRAAAAGARFRCVNEPVCQYRWYGGNLSADTGKIRRADAHIARKCLQRIPLPVLFPNLNWGSPASAITQASLIAALVFAERGDYRSCAEMAQQASAGAERIATPATLAAAPVKAQGTNGDLQQAGINFNGKALNVMFRGASIGDKGVLQQIFVAQDYKIDQWEQGKALQRFYRGIGPLARPLIVDAGANIGASALWFLNTFEDAFVFCIEPDVGNFALLETNTRDYERKLNFLGAVSGQDGRARVVDPGLSDWGFRTVESGDNAAGNGAEVETMSPPSILNHPRLVGMQPLIFKIDIEGGEDRLFAGDTSWMRRFPLIIIELHDWMLPLSGNARNFLHAVARYEFDIVQRSENLFLFNREILAPQAAESSSDCSLESVDELCRAQA